MPVNFVLASQSSGSFAFELCSIPPVCHSSHKTRISLSVRVSVRVYVCPQSTSNGNINSVYVIDATIEQSYQSDHSIIYFKIKFNDFEFGSGLWKHNNSFLKDLDCI